MSASIQLLLGSCMCSFLLSENVVSSEFRGGSRTAATSKMERFVIIVNGLKPLTIITKRSILDVATVLDPPLELLENLHVVHKKLSQSKSGAVPFDFKLKLGRSSVKRSVLGKFCCTLHKWITGVENTTTLRSYSLCHHLRSVLRKQHILSV